MKIVITGANGFVGAALCRYFSQQGHQVIATGRQAEPNARLLAYASYIQADITRPIEPFYADVCIHAAGLATDQASYDALFVNNVTGTSNVLEAAKNCKYFVFISSSSVYNFDGALPVETGASLNAGLSDYGKTKLLADELVKANIPPHQHRLILRPRAIYGIGDRLLLPRVLKLVKGRTVVYPANPGLQTSATHVDNIAYAIGLFLEQQSKPPIQVFNIADDMVYSLKDITLQILNGIERRSLKVVKIPLVGLKMLSVIRPKRVSLLALKTFTQNSVLDIQHIKKELNYKPVHNLDNSFAEISQWINNLGGKEVYLQNLNNAPWMI